MLTERSSPRLARLAANLERNNDSGEVGTYCTVVTRPFRNCTFQGIGSVDILWRAAAIMTPVSVSPWLTCISPASARIRRVLPASCPRLHDAIILEGLRGQRDVNCSFEDVVVSHGGGLLDATIVFI